MCVNSASTVLRGAGDNGEDKARQQARSSRVRQGVNKRLSVNTLFSLKKPVYSTSSTSIPLSFRTSPTRMPPLAISSSINRFRGLSDLKMNSSTTSFSRIDHRRPFDTRNVFFKILESQGLTNDGSTVFLMKLKRVLRRMYLKRLVVCFWPSVH